MITFFSLLTVICVSIDAFCLGYALGLGGISMKIRSFVIMGIIAGMLSRLAMGLGDLFFGIISEENCSLLCAFLFFLLAYMSASHEKDPEKHDKSESFTVALMGGFSVAVDASIAAFSLSLEGFGHPVYPLLFGLLHFLFSFAGYRLSELKISRRINRYVPSLSAIILSALGVMRLI